MELLVKETNDLTMEPVATVRLSMKTLKSLSVLPMATIAPPRTTMSSPETMESLVRTLTKSVVEVAHQRARQKTEELRSRSLLATAQPSEEASECLSLLTTIAVTRMSSRVTLKTERDVDAAEVAAQARPLDLPVPLVKADHLVVDVPIAEIVTVVGIAKVVVRLAQSM